MALLAFLVSPATGSTGNSDAPVEPNLGELRTPSLYEHNTNEVRIGVLASHGRDDCLKRWTPTATYLTDLVPSHRFSIVPLNLVELRKAVETAGIDFVISSSGSYVEFESRYGAARILTLRNQEQGQTLTQFGAVIFCRSDRTDIRNLVDLAGQSFMAVAPNAFGGFEMAWRELVHRGVDPFRDISDLRFSGFPQDQVAIAVRDGTVDAGTVRTGTLERMAANGRIDLNTFRILGSRQVRGFPLALSTQLYPEWPFAKLAHTPDELARQVATVLLLQPHNNNVSRASGTAGWTAPLSYKPVYDCFKDLQLDPYGNYGEITVDSVFRQYRNWIIATVLASSFLAFVALRVLRLNRRLQETHEDLAASESQNRAILNGAANAIITIDTCGTIRAFNTAAEKTFGHTRAEAVGQNIRMLMPKPYSSEHDLYLARYLKTGIAHILGQRREIVGLRRDGTTFPMELHVAEIESRTGRMFTGIARDITDIKLTEEKLLDAKRVAEVANQAKSEFLANMSHEIRTPMNGIIGMSELVLESDLTPEQRGHVSTVVDCANGLLQIINDILDFSKIEAGKLTIEAYPFDLPACVESVIDILGRRASQGGIELICDIAPDVPTYVVGDAGRFRQVLVNLASNAIKFTKKGEVTIDVNLVAMDEKVATIRCAIRDTGIGIPTDRLDAIFDSFTQADGATTRVFGGTGLGLTISRQISDLMNGSIDVESVEGEGSTFNFVTRLPIAAPVPHLVGAKPHAGTESPKKLRGKRVLVAEQNRVLRRTIGKWLVAWGADPVFAEDNGEAIGVLEEAWANRRPIDVVLWGMPTDTINASNSLISASAKRPVNQRPMFILLSDGSNLRPPIDDSVRTIGMTRPIKRSALGVALAILDPSDDAGLQAQCATATSDTAPPPTANSRTTSVLLVEDNAVNRQVALRILEKHHCTVKTASNGQSAIDALKTESFDLVFMDVQMPVLDGFGATKEIRKNPAFSDLPIIAMTANAMKGDRERCLDAGMNDYLSKPIRSEAVGNMLKKWTTRSDDAKPDADRNREEKAGANKETTTPPFAGTSATQR